MEMTKTRFIAMAAGLAYLGIGPAAGWAHELLVGRSSTDQILLHIQGDMPFDLGESPFPGFDGFAEAEPGWVATTEDLPDEGLFLLPGGSDLEFVLIASTEHIRVWNDTGTAPMQIGETYHIGQPLFHNHPIWQSLDGVPGEVYSLTVQLRDRNALLSESEYYVLEFEVTPTIAPGDIDGDGDVDLADLAVMLSSFGQCFGDPGFVSNADVDDDGCVSLADLAILLAHFGA
jgi:hypothetical protein